MFKLKSIRIWSLRFCAAVLLLISAASVGFIIRNACITLAPWEQGEGHTYGAIVWGRYYCIGTFQNRIYFHTREPIGKNGPYYSDYTGYSGALYELQKAKVNQFGFVPPQDLHHQKTPTWIIGAPLWFVAVILGLPGLWLTWRSWNMSRWFKRRKKGYCVKCGYDIRASKDRCPECGTEIPPPAAAATPPTIPLKNTS